MDPETEMIMLHEEESYLDGVIKTLKDLKKHKKYTECLEDIVSLIDKLKDRKKQTKKAIEDLTDELVSMAEIYEDIDFKALDDALC